MSEQTFQLKRPGGLAVGTGEHDRRLRGIAQSVLVLNLLDGIFTLLWVQGFGAGEANILLRDLAAQHAVQFMVVKLAMVSLGTLFLWRQRTNPLAVVAIFVAFFSYFQVLLLHLHHSVTLLL
jgi:hypothetical protein